MQPTNASEAILAVVRPHERVTSTVVYDRVNALPYPLARASVYSALGQLVAAGKLARVRLAVKAPTDPLYAYALPAP